MAVRKARGLLTALGLASLLCLKTAIGWADPPFKLDVETARRLAADGWDRGVDRKWFEDDTGPDDRFFVFYGLNKTDGGFGYFAVNPWTGEVWALWGCHKLSTPALRRSQAAIRRRFTRREEYDRLARLKPECVVED